MLLTVVRVYQQGRKLSEAELRAAMKQRKRHRDRSQDNASNHSAVLTESPRRLAAGSTQGSEPQRLGGSKVHDELEFRRLFKRASQLP